MMNQLIRWIILWSVLIVAIEGCTDIPDEYNSMQQNRIRGITLVDWTSRGYSRQEAVEAIHAIAATGARQLVLLVTIYQASPSSSTLYRDTERTPDPDVIRSAALAARSLGMEVTIKLHVDIEDGTWRAKINPSNPGDWFTAYRAYLLPLAALSDSLGASIFIVGCELAGTLQYRSEWRKTIAEVRTVFHGDVTYAASWDEAMLVPFWSDIDIVGIDCYVPLTVRDNPGRLEILAGWGPMLNRLELLHMQTERPIIFTEIGYRSINGAGRRPYDWQQKEVVDIAEQADLYWSAMEAVRNQSWCDGIIWWGWQADGTGGDGDDGYTPARKPAEDVLRTYWRK